MKHLHAEVLYLLNNINYSKKNKLAVNDN